MKGKFISTDIRYRNSLALVDAKGGAKDVDDTETITLTRSKVYYIFCSLFKSLCRVLGM